MGIRLKGAGFERFEILEKAGGVGGTWYHNRYPGCACDVPSHLYSFSFEIKRDWSRPYAPQPEILAYLEHCAEKYGLLPHCRFGDAVRRARWDEAAAQLDARARVGPHAHADVVVSAIGMFNEIAVPDIPGLDSFAGTRFHSARWNAGSRSRRRDGGRDRQRGERGAARAGDREAGRSRPPLPAHGELGGAEGGRSLHARSSSSASAAIPRSRWRCGRRSSSRSAAPASSSGCVPRWRPPAAPTWRWWRIRRCARACCPTIPGAASARSSPTTTTRPSTGRTSSWSPIRSSASRRPGS